MSVSGRRKMTDAWCSYADAGWSALPLCPPEALHHGRVSARHSRVCLSPGKMPLVARWLPYQSRLMTRGELEAALDAANLPASSPFNVGVVTGRVSGVIGVDIDDRAACEWLYARLPTEALDTASFVTGRGLRLLYSLPAGAPAVASCKVAPGVELLAEGRQTVMPPSVHPTGKVYAWSARSRKRLAPVPEELLALVKGRGGREGPASSRLAGGLDAGEVFAEGTARTRNSTLFGMARALHKRGAGLDSVLKCLAVLNRQCDPGLDERELRSIGLSACRYGR